ncbi:MAG: HEPN domain-containing protein [Chitinivibrionia bacterium]|nr:HEPN domain-containing protein [Chitinivibrionia bacterium]
MAEKLSKDEELRQWFSISAKDLWIAEHLYTTLHPTPDEMICFLCQQSVEKSLKGFLCFNDIEFDRTHDLPQLLAKCIALNSDFKDYAKHCAFLSKYAVMPRYPNDLQINDDEVNVAIRFAEKIKDFALSKVILPPF